RFSAPAAERPEAPAPTMATLACGMVFSVSTGGAPEQRSGTPEWWHREAIALVYAEDEAGACAENGSLGAANFLSRDSGGRGRCRVRAPARAMGQSVPTGRRR